MDANDISNMLKEDFNCAQIVLSNFSKNYNLNDELAFKIASGFGGGMGRLQETCGAVTGAFMVIGLENGYCKKNQADLKEKTYKLVKEFARRFKEKNNTISCKELLGCDLNTDEGRKKFKEFKLSEKVCVKCIRDSIEILENIL